MSGEAPRVSAIIVTRGRREALARCLASLRGQEPPLEVVVVENGGGDGSVEMVREAFPETLLISQGRNLGTSLTRNLGVLAARGEYLWFLDDDTEVTDPGLAARLAECCAADATLGGIGGEALLDGDGRIVGVKRLRLLANGMIRGEHLSDLAAGELMEADTLATCSLFTPRAAFEAVGGFDPLFPFYREDMDLSWRLRAAGFRLAVMGRLPVIHHFDEAGRGVRLFTPQRYRTLYAVKNFPWWRVALLPLLDLAYLLSPGSLGRLLHFGRRGGGARAATAAEGGGLGAGRLARALLKGAATALSLAASYPLALSGLPAALRQRFAPRSGLEAARGITSAIHPSRPS